MSETFTPFKDWVAKRKSPIEFEDYRTHCKPLNIKARGKVLVIGPSDMSLEEIALIEDDISANNITEVIMSISGPPLDHLISIFEEFHPKCTLSTVPNTGVYFHNNPCKFDTILFIGTPLPQPTETIKFLSEHLNQQGFMYLTVNVYNPPVVSPINGIQCTITPVPLPPHPYYNRVGNYYGVIVRKT